VASAARLIAIAILEVPIVGRARWFVRLPDVDRPRSLLRFNRISARSMAQQTASGSWSVHRAAGADVDCVRIRRGDAL
jgi:hypothetical protein